MIRPEKARDLLKNSVRTDSNVETTNGATKETDFISTMISKVEENFDPTSTDPSQAIGSMMSSGVMTDFNDIDVIWNARWIS